MDEVSPSKEDSWLIVSITLFMSVSELEESLDIKFLAFSTETAEFKP